MGGVISERMRGGEVRGGGLDSSGEPDEECARHRVARALENPRRGAIAPFRSRGPSAARAMIAVRPASARYLQRPRNVSASFL